MTEDQRLFIQDAREILIRLDRDLEQLRLARLQGRRRRELAAQIFRRIHTLKGSGASLGFRSVSEIAHRFEGVLDGARLGRLELTDAVLDTFEDALDEIARGLQAPSKDVSPAVELISQRLAALADKSRGAGVIAGGLREALPEDVARALSEYDLQHAREAIREGAKLFIVAAAFAIDTFDEAFRELSKLLGQSGEIIATVPGQNPTTEEINFRLLYATELLSAETLRIAGSLGRVDHYEIKIDLPAVHTSAARQAYPMHARLPPANAQNPVRVELKQIDDLISASGELFKQSSAVVRTLDENAEAVNQAISNLRERFSEFEERLIKLRLTSMAELFERAAARGGRIAARQLGKEIEFVIIGSDVGIEQSLAEIITDPLLHLVRNAITHGIEDPQTRIAAGKNPTGRITLAASNHSGRIHITVTDDGRGIDLERVARAAAEQGIPSQGLSDDQCLRLIFRPGFSTANDLTEMAGRGIGLDIVDRGMDLAGGEARVTTQRGCGTTFALIVPAALSLVKCLIVRCNNQLYAIDSACVAGVDSNAVDADSSTHCTTETDDLPLRHLSSLLGGPEKQSQAGVAIVWQSPAPSANGSAQRYRIACDAIVGKHETLVRSLGRYAPRWAGVCGAAEMFDGNVALMLDLEELIKAQPVV